jgi:hypothetical protein
MRWARRSMAHTSRPLVDVLLPTLRGAAASAALHARTASTPLLMCFSFSYAAVAASFPPSHFQLFHRVSFSCFPLRVSFSSSTLGLLSFHPHAHFPLASAATLARHSICPHACSRPLLSADEERGYPIGPLSWLHVRTFISSPRLQSPPAPSAHCPAQSVPSHRAPIAHRKPVPFAAGSTRVGRGLAHAACSHRIRVRRRSACSLLLRVSCSTKL